ncbi:head-tail connector protein [Neptunicoccus cionae]|uniref:Phage gp6-like head-tail connector protein n=1 Tax=Neptunicoccus cionae TaxID=2035344 RepID=A0A916VR15_9RHOB|nr:hypothetical protein [Amylibacter cionae]GGA22985.1 hypothetical protein GCM10011498_24700 [Amylibacter cionae]
MILTELSSVPSGSLPLALLKEHLRLGTGFSSGAEQDDLLEAYLRAAISAVEGRTGLVLLEKSFNWALTAWRHYDRQVLPVRPVQSVDTLTLVDRAGGETVMPPETYHLERDSQNPALVAVGLALAVIPDGGSAEISFTAGYGPVWSDVPPDLARAVLLLAAEFYEHRASREGASLPTAILSLLERFRKVRLLGGA